KVGNDAELARPETGNAGALEIGLRFRETFKEQLEQLRGHGVDAAFFNGPRQRGFQHPDMVFVHGSSPPAATRFPSPLLGFYRQWCAQSLRRIKAGITQAPAPAQATQ